MMAVARPMPLAEPVTKAALPSMFTIHPRALATL
jgi:hypothetical protein